MNQRTALRSDLRAAWESVISKKYDERLIDSEASLQVHFCMALLSRFCDEGRVRRIFVEPSVQVLNPSIYKKPDLLICNQRQIIGMVELKYVPRGRATYSKDLETLAHLSENRLKFEISNQRYRGPKGLGRTFTLASDAVLCWAGVYSGSKINNEAFSRAESRQDFLALHALTSKENNAVIICS